MAQSKTLAIVEKMLRELPPYGTEYLNFQLPSALRKGHENYYTPRVVSIGPLHHGLKRLQGMEIYKTRYLEFCLSYKPNNLNNLISSLERWEKEVRNTYKEEHFHEKFSGDKFVRMMLFDGCFIIQLLIFSWNRQVAPEYDREMFATDFLNKDVKFDLMLVENQLPFFLLERLFELILTDKQRGKYSFFDVAKKYFNTIVEMGGNVLQERGVVDPNHFGDLILKCFRPSTDYKRPPDKHFGDLKSATELHNLGVQIKKSEDPNLLNITFTKKGVLAIPKLTITRSTISRFRNIIAMELCHPDSTHHVTDYMMLMNYLVNTRNDVSMLRSCEVIDSRYFGNDEQVVQFFSSITGGVITSIRDSYYYGLIHELNMYSNNSWNHWGVRLREDYFSSPWTILSLVAALTILVGTTVGAIFAVLSFTK